MSTEPEDIEHEHDVPPGPAEPLPDDELGEPPEWEAAAEPREQK